MGEKIWEIEREQRRELGDNNELTDVQFVVKEINKMRDKRYNTLGVEPQLVVDETIQDLILELLSDSWITGLLSFSVNLV